MTIPFHSLFLNFGTPLKRVSQTDNRSWTRAVCTSCCYSLELGFLVFCFTGKDESNKFNRLETKPWKYFLWYFGPIILNATLRKICHFYIAFREPKFSITFKNQIFMFSPCFMTIIYPTDHYKILAKRQTHCTLVGPQLLKRKRRLLPEIL